MTTTTGDHVDTDRSLRRAELLLGRARLGQASLDVHGHTVAMLARILAAYDPFDHPHGRLLAAALRPRTRAEQRTGPPPAEQAVRALLRTGQPPWPTAVAAHLDQQQQRTRPLAAKAAQLGPTAERDAAAAVSSSSASGRPTTVRHPRPGWGRSSAGTPTTPGRWSGSWSTTAG